MDRIIVMVTDAHTSRIPCPVARLDALIPVETSRTALQDRGTVVANQKRPTIFGVGAESPSAFIPEDGEEEGEGEKEGAKCDPGHFTFYFTSRLLISTKDQE